jgi:hypothetical protein
MLTEKQCKEEIVKDLEGVKSRIDELLENIKDGSDLVDISMSLERIERGVDDAKSRLESCEDY